MWCFVEWCGWYGVCLSKSLQVDEDTKCFNFSSLKLSVHNSVKLVLLRFHQQQPFYHYPHTPHHTHLTTHTSPHQPHHTNHTTPTTPPRSIEDILKGLESNQISLATSKHSPYAAAFADQIDQWERILSTISETVELLLIIQKCWLYLEVHPLPPTLPFLLPPFPSLLFLLLPLPLPSLLLPSLPLTSLPLLPFPFFFFILPKF